MGPNILCDKCEQLFNSEKFDSCPNCAAEVTTEAETKEE